jgi:asparagine synthase (glutamine-hydrolysing)
MRMETWAAWSAPYGFQYRFPLTDRRLLEFLFKLPPEQLFLDSKPRGLALAVLADCIPPSASKQDLANQRLRRDTRNQAWAAIAKEASGGGFDDDCPWIDRNSFLTHASSPLDQSRPENIIAFGEVFPAVQMWHLYRRATRNGWV